MLSAASVFQQGMLLQRSIPVVIWGRAASNSVVEATIQKQSAEAVANKNGDWKLELPPLRASAQETLVLKSGEEVLTFSDVAVGEVWLAGGQSNMEFHMRYEKHLTKELTCCPNDCLRFYDVPKISFAGQAEAFDFSQVGRWRRVTAEDLEWFSAVGYYFQKALELALDVPVGIIGCNLGGTSSAAWMPRELVEEIGKPWMADFLEKTEGLNLNSYFENQKTNPRNNKGLPFEDAFSELMLPKTPSMEEIMEFFAREGIDPSVAMDTVLPQDFPGALYDHMVCAIAPYTVRGVLWYQGEGDSIHCEHDLYVDMLAGLIQSWRECWERELPFLIVQLPGHEQWMGATASAFPAIRHSQELAAQRNAGVWLCSISDAGEQYDVHPKDKRPVGTRLALLARGHIYGEDILCDAPVLETVSRQGNRIQLNFRHAEGGLHLQGETLNAMQVLSGGARLPFRVQLDHNRLLLEVDSPEEVEIRFAQDPWYQVNLYNASGIPAIPFQVTVPY